ncbi:MAG: protein-glutamate O-methyltransferase CheR [Bacteroidetes bacterium]|jgi:chemotaxis protein methyltransferase CheR|nr:protein-glutamate O-methyltransferase CheR [Bacteroidota bacterium]MBU1578956.1 protein-glutamate O-methyltransferase CheR [Bacteroidota bacterium]MBU2556433.1 protein-glutamate O-methyltransferase CheR [Bacteroidota bacterium]MDA3943940.1 protein-glutamate O-methyltransferase CheR [Bacteroidota bacterium]
MQNNHEEDVTSQIELELLLEAIFRQYGYDFRNYSRAHVKRRLYNRLRQHELASFSQLQHAILYDVTVFHEVLRDLSINVTEMFRDPAFYASLRAEVIPILKTYPYIKIWHAGCATGEEVYSFAILLMEEGLYERSQIYATDFNTDVLETAQKGIYPTSRMKEYTLNYQAAGGKESFSKYYTARYDAALFDPELKKNIVFAEHNLVTDSVFSEVNLIICRNVLIYFNRSLQNKVMELFAESLIKGGFLGLGTKENIMFSPVESLFKVLDAEQKIYQKKFV